MPFDTTILCVYVCVCVQNNTTMRGSENSVTHKGCFGDHCYSLINFGKLYKILCFFFPSSTDHFSWRCAFIPIVQISILKETTQGCERPQKQSMLRETSHGGSALYFVKGLGSW